MTETTTPAAPSGTVGADVRPCEFTGMTDCKGCPASECFYVPDDGDTYDDEPACDCGGDGCPECCGNDYAPGTEECDFCRWSDVCAGVEGPNAEVDRDE